MSNSPFTLLHGTRFVGQRPGGLGLRPSGVINQVLLAKLFWRFLSSTTKFWSRVLAAKYGTLDNLSPERQQHKSNVWRSVIWGFTLLTQGLRHTIGSIVSSKLWWQPLSTSIFTTKSAFQLAQVGGQVTGDFNWKALWQFKGPSRGSLLLWHVIWSAEDLLLPLGTEHHSNPDCQVCWETYESTMHALRDCVLAKQLCDLLIPNQLRPRFRVISHMR